MTYPLEILDLRTLLQAFPPRAKDAHKGDFGHLLVIGGNKGMSGAARLAGEAAARVGAGMVSIATKPEHTAGINAVRPELMCHGVQTVEELELLLQRAMVIVIGTGLGQDEWGKALFLRVLETSHPKIMDADALNLLSQNPVNQSGWILTPHPGEAGRLLGCKTADVQSDRLSAVTEIRKRYGGVVVLKGAGTLVQGETQTAICHAGNPGMATGGMGDVLSGVIGGLVAQGLPLERAACLGVMVHALAADQAVSEKGERGLLALDIMDGIRACINLK